MSRAPRPRLLSILALSSLLLGTALPLRAITVTSLADSGPGTLREAIDIANSDGVPTTITFAPGLAGGTIPLASPLPIFVEGGTTIDGDLGGDCAPDIAIDGQWMPSLGINLSSNGNRIAGLAIHSFNCPGCGGDVIMVWASAGNLIECNNLGTDLSGATPLGSSACGVKLIQGATGTTVRNNRIVFNSAGVCILEGSSSNTIGPGNEIANGVVGVQVFEDDLGGFPDFASLTPDAVQSFPTIDFSDDCAGFHRLGDPILLDGLGHPFGDGFGMRLTGEVDLNAAGDYLFEIPHLDDLARLIVDSVELLNVYAPGPHSVTVSGLSAGVHSIELDFFEGGGAAVLELSISGPGAATLSTGTAPPAGCPASQPGLCGELFQRRNPAEGNRITENSIHGNTWLGIALNCCCSPIANDAGDLDLGANTVLNHPEITTVLPIGGGLYSATGTAPPDSIVEIFVSDSDPLGFGEGREYLGSTTADPGGNFSIGLPLDPGDSVLTATATDSADNTSEFGPNYAPGSGLEMATVDSTITGLPGATLEIPVYARDASLTPLGTDRPVGERIQSLSYKVSFSPASSIASKLFARAGITAGLAPVFEVTPTTATTASYLGTFDESTNPISFTLDDPAPGDQVLKIVVTLAADAPAGTIVLALDPIATELGNQAGTLLESQANGWLTLASGQLMVLSNAASALRSYAVSSSAIQLDWNDPNQNETGFRLERSTDSASWATVTTLGPDETNYLDAGGLVPATLYYYRLVTLVPTDSHISNVTAASTFPATAAKVCPQPLATPARSFAFTPSTAWGDGVWGIAWLGREAAVQDEIYFRLFDATTLAPLGSLTRVSASASPADRVRADRPTLAYSDPGYGRWGMIWTEGLPGEPGGPLDNSTFFALLAADGSLERGGVRISSTTNDHPWEDGLPPPLAWDGTHWGTFELTYATPPELDLVYRRLDADGDVVLGPVTVLAPAAAHVSDIDAAWNSTSSKYGLFWQQIHNDDIDLYFQVMEESTGALEGSATHLDGYFSVVGTYGGSVVADGAGWAVAWTDLVDDLVLGEIAVSWMQQFDASGTPLGPATRLSDDPPTDGGVAILARKPVGGFAAFVSCFDFGSEICRLETDGAGNRIGSLTPVTPADGARTASHHVAANGSDFLVVFADRASGTLEIGGSLVPVADFSTPGLVVSLTAGHDLPTAAVGNSIIVPLGAGFAAVWLDSMGGSNLLQARTWDGTGGTLATLSPLTSTPARGRPAVAAVGAELAMAWRDVATDDLWFARYDATGTPLSAETSVSTIGSTANVAMDFSGEVYGLLWARSGGLNFLRVAPDGSPVGTDLLVPVGNVAGPAPQVRWVGAGWAVVWRSGNNNLHYAFLAPDGSPVTLDVPLSAATQSAIADSFHLIWTGLDLGLAWSTLRDLDPPLDDIYFVRLGLDGAMAFPPVTAVSTSQRDLNPLLYWTPGDSHFHLVHSAGGIVGAREIELQTDGTVLPGERYWTNRSVGALAWNGTTLGYMIGVDGNLFFETSECVTDDSTAPPCPALSVASFDDLLRLDWSPISDPQSGIFRYHVYRDGLPLGKTWAATTYFDDGGFGIGATHLYQVRALNGAWNESNGCTSVAYSTTAGDANGDGSYGVADIFYLINFFFGDGPPPAGNADANGDNSVSVSDIFYMINNLFSGGPPPLPITGGEITASASVELAAEAPLPGGQPAAVARAGRSRLIVGSAIVAPGATVRIPIDLVDRPGTPLGPERPWGDRIQALALAIACSPCDGIAALAIEPAGALARYGPTFESRPGSPGHTALITVYDEGTSPLFLGFSTSKLRQRVATLVVQLAPSAHAGTTIDLRLDPGITLLSNQAGTLHETVPNGWLELADGRLEVGTRPSVDAR